MNNENLKKQRAIKSLIENQLRILKLNGSTNKELTLSLPKVDDIDEDVIKNILHEIFSYEPDILFYQEISCKEASTVILVTI